jgi:hypothetical protein
MREEFIRLRGYDPIPYLPVFTGRVVRSREASERFLWDVRQTVSDLLLENYAGYMRDLARQHGLRLSIEAYDDCPCDNMAYAGRCDEPMAEFWAVGNDTAYSCLEMSSAAHVYGKRILGAEAFTATDAEKWLFHPGSVKILGDWAFCQGINRFVFHRYALQPWLDRKPGMSMGPWGLHYERTETWWEQTKPWHEYLARCQFMLRQGLFVADICYLQPEGSPRRFVPPLASNKGPTPDRPGYNYDGCTPEVVLTRMSVKDGRIVLPDGMSYRLLVLPESQTMTPRLLGKIAELVEAGATVVGPRPLKSPSLSGYPDCDQQVKQLADRLWGDCDGKKIFEHRTGKGRIFWGKTPEKVFQGLDVPEDFAFEAETKPQPGDPSLRYIHRRMEDGTDLYFVANKTTLAQSMMCWFRAAGRRPELWWPESGRIERAAENMELPDSTAVPLRLEAAESVFVVFRASAKPGDPVVYIRHDGATGFRTLCAADFRPNADGQFQLTAWNAGQYELKTAAGRTLRCRVAAVPEPSEIAGPWEVQFPPGGGAPQKITLPKLQSWSEHADPGVKYFSGTASYEKVFTQPATGQIPHARVFLDLGNVQVTAQVKLNGRDLGVLWKSPYRVEITDALKPGENRLQVDVTNLWINRMIGDEQLPEDSDRNKDGTLKSWPQWLQEGKPSPTGRHTFTSWRLWKKDSPLQPSGLLGPVTLQTAVDAVLQ